MSFNANIMMTPSRIFEIGPGFVAYYNRYLGSNIVTPIVVTVTVTVAPSQARSEAQASLSTKILSYTCSCLALRL